jgi:hypothetical protein
LPAIDVSSALAKSRSVLRSVRAPGNVVDGALAATWSMARPRGPVGGAFVA